MYVQYKPDYMPKTCGLGNNMHGEVLLHFTCLHKRYIAITAFSIAFLHITHQMSKDFSELYQPTSKKKSLKFSIHS